MAKVSKKDIIVQKALKYFSLYGYENTNLELIANDCGITKPAIYYHFKDKAALYKESICMLFLEIATQIEKNCADGSAEEKLQNYIKTFGDFLISNPDFNAIFAREIANGAKTLPLECTKSLSRTLFKLKEILEDGFKEKVFEIENPFMIQMMIVSTLTSYNTSKPLRENVAEVIGTTHAPEPNFKNVVESLSKTIIKGLRC